MKNTSLLRLQYYCVLGAVAGAVMFATLRYMPAAGSGAALSTTSALATAAAPAGAGDHWKSKGMAQAPTKAAAKVARKPKEVVVFNFDDSNSDTGGVAAIMGIRIAPPEGRAFFHHPTGRLSDGRVILDPHCAVVLHLARLFA
ncbi:GDSL esterase/lipase ACHE-like [Hordeum vulgare subsp. vulgare]|uniref:GDSL esterase/lipase ACHE-like n=1 Tax=Hordeum vulgare subsp. vulgare TaxID=112509 RepID=UPI001D1A4F5F|nr:GDSL esterase/lipase ACHE-like [Hordeum vulgare subsp. vulgare]